MKSHRFSILKTGIVIVWPWLFKQILFMDLSVIVIYPFVFVCSRNQSLLSNKDLDGNMTLIFVKQQEELLELLLCLLVPLFFVIGWWTLLLLLSGPLLSVYLFIKHWYRKRYTIRGFTYSFAFAFILSEFPTYTEAYANCNFPNYLKIREIFAWRKYIKP